MFKSIDIFQFLKVTYMTIFFVSRGWPSEREPQWGSFERDQALALSKLGHQIVVLSVDARFRKYYRKYGITKTVHEGITQYDLFAGSIWGNALRKTFINLHIKMRRFFFMRLFEKVIEAEGKPDLIYAHYLGSSSMALAAKRKYGIPVVGIEHWSELGYDNIKKPIKKWAGDVYSELDCLLTVSSALRDNIKMNFGIGSTVVNNMIGCEFNYVPHDNTDGVVRFVSTGNLLPVKGFDILVKAFSQCSLPLDTWSLEIVGGGKENDNLKRLIEGNGLADNIHLLGRKDRDGVISTLRRSDVYVMSSRSETFGVAATEALACGLPAIATDCGGARDFMKDFNGLLIPKDSVEALADAINKMVKSYKRYDRRRIAEDCHNSFSGEGIAKQLIRVFERVLDNNK